MRIGYIKRLLLRDNFKKLIFWSQAGKDTLHTYGGIDDERILEKVAVVYALKLFIRSCINIIKTAFRLTSIASLQNQVTGGSWTCHARWLRGA